MNTINLHTHTNSEIPLRDSTPPVKSERARHELPGLRHEPKDVLQQLQTNIALLEDQCGRLNFMLSEVRSVIRR